MGGGTFELQDDGVVFVSSEGKPLARVVSPCLVLSNYKRIRSGWTLQANEEGVSFNNEAGYVVSFSKEGFVSCRGDKASGLSIAELRFDVIPLEKYPYGLVQGYQSWNLNKSIKPSDKRTKSLLTRLTPFLVGMFKDTDHPTWRDRTITSRRGMDSFDVVVFSNGDDNFLFGVTSCKVAQTAFWMPAGGKEFSSFLCVMSFGRHAKPADTVLGEYMTGFYSKESLGACKLLEKYGDASMAVQDTDLPRDSEMLKLGRAPVGFSSWYQLYENVTAKDMTNALEQIRDDPRIDKIVNCVQLDDGFQLATGDWLETRKRFGEKDLSKVAKSIRCEEQVPGLWLAPFIVSKTSNIARAHPDWLLKNKKGKKIIAHVNGAWLRGCNLFSMIQYCLDLSHPEVLAHLEDLFSKLTVDWDWFKIDFLAAGMREGVRYDPSQTRVEAYINGMKAIRKGAGPKAFLLGCGAPILASAQSGVLDSMRTTCDTKEAWEPTGLQKFFAFDWDNLPAVDTVLWGNMTRMYMHRRLFPLSDPDCMLIRDKGSSLTDIQIHTQLTVLGLTGGLLLFTDDLTKLEKERLELGLRILPASPLSGRACHLMSKKRPDGFLMVGEDAGVRAIINWSSKKKPSHFDLEYGGFEFWTKTIITGTSFDHKPYQSCALQYPKKPCLLLGNTLNLTAIADGRIKARNENDGDKTKCIVSGTDITSITQGDLIFTEKLEVVSSSGVTTDWSAVMENALTISITAPEWEIVVQTK